MQIFSLHLHVKHNKFSFQFYFYNTNGNKVCAKTVLVGLVWFIFDLVNELITIIDLKIETNITALDYG